MKTLTLQKEVTPIDTKWEFKVDLNQFESKHNRKQNRQQQQAQQQSIKSIKVHQSGITLSLVPKHNNRMLQNEEDISKFVIVNFSDLRFQDQPMKMTLDYIEKFLKTGITINKKTYRFFGCSNSQLKSKTCYLYNGSVENINKIINNMGDFSNMNSIAKKMKRIGLLFTSTEVGIELKEKDYEDIDDIENEKGDVFTDGCGFISQKFAELIAKKRGIVFRNSKYTPSVFQIRYKGYKGVVMQKKDLAGKKVQFRKSMNKFSGCSDTSFSAKNYSTPYTFGKLNAELITLLSALGIRDEIFIQKQNEYFEFIQQATRDIKIAFEFCCYKNDIKMAERVINDGLTPEILKHIKKIASEEWKSVTQTSDDERKKKIKIYIPESRLLFGVCDPSETLKEGEVFVRVTIDGTRNFKTVEGAEIIVSRNPCLHPGDIQKFKAVDVPELRYLRDVIVFPTVGRRPAASLLSGGDLDGDRFFVCWDKDLIPDTIFEAYGYPPAKLAIQRDITYEKMIQYFVRWNNASLGKIKNLYLDWCRVSKEGAASSECQELNTLFSSAVDAEKVEIPERLTQLPENVERSFIVDTLWENMRLIAANMIQTDLEVIQLNPSDSIDLLLTSEVNTLSEFHYFQIVHDVCIRSKDKTMIEYLHHFNYDAFSDVEKQWAVKMMADVGNFSGLFLNSLNQSGILTRHDLKSCELQTAANHWKRLYSTFDDDTRRFGSCLAQSFSEFKRKLVVLEVNDLLKVAIYLPKKLDFGFDDTYIVDDCVKIFAFTNTQSGNLVKSTVKDYRLQFSNGFFQLYLREKKNNTFVFFVVKEDWKTGKLKIRTSIALQKFDQKVKKQVGQIKQEPAKQAEIYVISHRDRIGHQLLDVSENAVKTVNYRRCIENIPKKFEFPKMTNIDFSKYPEDFKKILNEKNITLLKNLSDVSYFQQLFELCIENGGKYQLILMTNFIFENFKEIKHCNKVINQILSMIPRQPYLALEVADFVGKSAMKNFTDVEIVQILKGVINTCNETPPLALNQMGFVLTFLRDKNVKLSYAQVTELCQAITFGIRRKTLAQEFLHLLLYDFKDTFVDSDQQSNEYFRKFICGICVDYLCEVDDQTEIDACNIPVCGGKEVLCRDVKSTENSGVYMAEIRVDSHYRPKTNDHIRFVLATNEEDTKTLIAFDGIVSASLPGSFKFKIQQETPNILFLASWCLIPCNSTTTLNAMFDALLNLVKQKENSIRDYKTLVFGMKCVPEATNELISTAPIEFRNKKMNPSQKEAIAMALSDSFTLIWGPPGTGKTTVVVEMIYQLTTVFEDEQILVCASTHNAVDNILEKFLAVSRVNKDEILRVSTDVSKVKKSLQIWTIDAFIGRSSQENKAKKEAKSRVKKAKYIFTTCTGAGIGLLRKENFRIVIIDEASQLTEPNCLIPIVKGSKKIVMVGDHVQLRPTVSIDAEMYGLQTSLFERLYNTNGITKTMLNVQYRMNPLLADIASKLSYNGQLQSGVSEDERKPPSCGFIWPEVDGRMLPGVFVDCKTEESPYSKSKSNDGQANCVVEIVKRLRDCEIKFSIVVLSPYTKQVELVRNKLRAKNLPGVDVNTIDGFQGRESDVVIVTTVRKNDVGNLGFCDDPRRINVALTRAKIGLVVVGHKTTLEASGLWKEYLTKLKKVEVKQ